MRAISPNIKVLLIKDGQQYGCLRRLVLNDHTCEGRITFEHVWIYAGKQIDEYWAIIPLCAKAHSVDDFQDSGILDKEINEWLSLRKVKPDDLKKYYKKDWSQRKKYLESKYGQIPLLL